MRIVLAVGVFWLVGSCGLVLFSRLRRYRIDLKPDQNAYDGASRVPPANYLSRANYSTDGYALLRWFWTWHVVMLATQAVIIWLLLGAG
jgi:hypothetical protein